MNCSIRMGRIEEKKAYGNFGIEILLRVNPVLPEC